MNSEVVYFSPENMFVLLTAILVAVPACILGVFLMMRRLVMVGDAISHAVLPGIVVAYLLTGSRDAWSMLIGAAVMGVLTTIFIDFLNRRLRIQEDAAIGTAFTFLFALGVLLIAVFAGNNTDLDQDCVLFGKLELTFMDQRVWNGYMIGTGASLQLLPISLLVIGVIFLAFRPLQIWAFNADFGKTKGLKMNRWQLLIMALVSLHAVFSFGSVGAIMVVGMLVLPAASAYLISGRMKRVLTLSVIIGILGCIVGFMVALTLDISMAPTIVAVCGVFFLLVWIVTSLLNRFRRPSGLIA